MSLMRMPWIQQALRERREVVANLDQDPLQYPHCVGDGQVMPVILASISHMFSLVRGRPMTPEDRVLLCTVGFGLGWGGRWAGPRWEC